MRVLVQRVAQASVQIAGDTCAQIEKGLLVFLGVGPGDDQTDVEWLANKILNLRIFNDEDGKMNLDLAQAGGDLLIVSQFTLHASTRKGNRPSYMAAALPENAIPLYEAFVEEVGRLHSGRVETGQFGADMKVSLLNDGPVTIWIDSRNRE